MALGVVSFFMTGVFAVSSKSSEVLKSVREFAGSSRAVQDRLEDIQRMSWIHVTSSSYLRDTFLASTPVSENVMPTVTEEITVSPYPAASPAATPILVERKGTAARVVTDNTTLVSGRMVRVNVRWTWTGGLDGRTHVRETSTLVSRRSSSR